MTTEQTRVDVLSEVIALVSKATPGLWSREPVKNEGDYGMGDECHTGFSSYAATDEKGIALFDTLNSGDGEVAVEFYEDGADAYDVIGLANIKAAISAVNFIRTYGAAVTELLAAASDGRDQPYKSGTVDGMHFSPAKTRRLRAALQAFAPQREDK